MSETIERLDYTKAPPGYRLVRDVDGFLFIDAGGKRHASAMHNLGGDWREDFALARAWAHYKREHDPPGFTVRGFRFGAGWVADVAVGIKPTAESTLVLVDDNGAVFVDACAARVYAWAWHDRRHALSLRDEARLGFPIFTMAGYLALTDAQVEHAEANAIGHGPAPEPIDYAADLALLGEDPEVGALIEAHARDKAAQGRYADS